MELEEEIKLLRQERDQALAALREQYALRLRELTSELGQNNYRQRMASTRTLIEVAGNGLLERIILVMPKDKESNAGKSTDLMMCASIQASKCRDLLADGDHLPGLQEKLEAFTLGISRPPISGRKRSFHLAPHDFQPGRSVPLLMVAHVVDADGQRHSHQRVLGQVRWQEDIIYTDTKKLIDKVLKAKRLPGRWE